MCFALLVMLALYSTAYSQHFFLGMDYEGGDGYGTIFELDTNGKNKKVLYKFNSEYSGQVLAGPLIKIDSVTSIGAMQYGGTYLKGTLFVWNTKTDKMKKVIDFDDSIGSNPFGSLLLAKNGLIYGTTSSGGANYSGSFFEFNPKTNDFKVLLYFDSAIGQTAVGNIFQAANNKLYIHALTGGKYGNGTFIEHDYVSNKTIKKIDLSDTTGYYGNNEFNELDSGYLIKVCNKGGSNKKGTIIKYNYSTNKIEVKFNFTTAEGNFSDQIAISDSNNIIFTSYNTGLYSAGRILEFNLTNDSLYSLYDFGNSSLGSPFGRIMNAGNNKFIGTASSIKNVLYEFDYQNKTTKFLLNLKDYGIEYLTFPFLTANKNRSIASTRGGSKNASLIFEYLKDSNKFIIVKNLNQIESNNPIGKLIQAPNNKFYGISGNDYYSGKSDIFEWDHLNNKFRLVAKTQGEITSNLTLGSNKNLYGVAKMGNGYYGTVFEYNIKKDTIMFFDGLTSSVGIDSKGGGLTEIDSGIFLGTAYSGGSNILGTIYEFNSHTKKFTLKINFIKTNGAYPEGSLLLARNGKIYGTTSAGGSKNLGTIFEYDYSTNSLKTIHHFTNNNDGAFPVTKLIEGKNNMLYGTTYGGAKNGYGLIYEINNKNYSFTNLFEFYNDTPNCSLSQTGELLLSRAGKLYGQPNSSKKTLGLIFEFDLLNKKYTKTHECDIPTGFRSTSGTLTEVCFQSFGTRIDTTCNSEYVSPSKRHKWNKSGIYKDTILNHFRCDSILTIYLSSFKINDSIKTDLVSLIALDTSCDSYQWYDCKTNSIMPNENKPKFTPNNTETEYYVKLMKNNCIINSKCVSLKLLKTSRKKLAVNELIIKPNPNYGKLSFNRKLSNGEHLEIYNNAGQTVEFKRINNDIIDISGLPDGIYFIKIISKNYIYTIKSIKTS